MYSMLVGMVKLRREGKRVSAEALRHARPVHGLLRVCPEPTARHAAAADRAALLLPASGSHVPLAELHAVRIHAVTERGLVLSGVEESFRRKERFTHRQAWWCWPVDRHAFDQAMAPDPVDVEEERAQIPSDVG